MMALEEAVLGTVVVFTLIAAWTDARDGHIPNPLVIAFAATAVVVRLAVTIMAARHAVRSPWPFVGDTLASVFLGLLAAGAVPYLLFRLGAMGGGDVKLLAALGMALGPAGGLQVELAAFVIASLYAGARLAYRGLFFRMIKNSFALLARPLVPIEKRADVSPELLTSLRFAPVLFAATLAFAYSAWRPT
jgi:prepilin peptidase CpaA